MKPIEINNKTKYNFINLFFPVIVEAQWFRVLTTNLLIMSTNPAGTHNFYLSQIFKTYIFVKYCEI